jgi:hypothetical protein
MPELEERIVAWRRQMLAAGIEAPMALDELESHLREGVEQRMRSGLTASQAFEAAVHQLGTPQALKIEFVKSDGGQTARSRKDLFHVVGRGLGAFMIGAAFCYFVVLPLALGSGKHYAWSAAYFAFVGKLMLGTGLVFMVLVTLPCFVGMGLLDSGKMAGFRRYAIVLNLILGALLTTPEVVTQLLMFIPLQLLYEAAIWIVRYSEHHARKRVES